MGAKVIDLEGYKEEKEMQGNTARKMYNNDDVINVMTFDEWENVRESMSNRQLQKKRKERKKMALYFRRQRAFGCVIMAFAVVCMIIGKVSGVEELGALGIVAGIAALYVIMTKHMMYVNEYFLEHEDKINQY